MLTSEDLAQFKDSIMTGIIVGKGSMTIMSGAYASIIVPCRFYFAHDGIIEGGHGEEPNDSLLLFALLNQKIEKAEFICNQLTLDFGASGGLKIVPEKNGLESYVVSTPLGIVPVIAS